MKDAHTKNGQTVGRYSVYRKSGALSPIRLNSFDVHVPLRSPSFRSSTSFRALARV